jgi:hypothetical protein
MCDLNILGTGIEALIPSFWNWGMTCIATSSLAMISSWITCLALAFWPRRPNVFLPIFWWPAPIFVDVVNLSVR